MGVSEASESLKLLKEPHGESGQVTFVSSCNQPPGVSVHAGRLFLAQFGRKRQGASLSGARAGEGKRRQVRYL